jgi:hypothetical protein
MAFRHKKVYELELEVLEAKINDVFRAPYFYCVLVLGRGIT